LIRHASGIGHLTSLAPCISRRYGSEHRIATMGVARVRTAWAAAKVGSVQLLSALRRRDDDEGIVGWQAAHGVLLSNRRPPQRGLDAARSRRGALRADG
jgi:hypothetical protein